MPVKLNAGLYIKSGKPDTTSGYSGGNKSLSTLVQAVLPYSSSGLTGTGQAQLVIDCNNGNLSGEDIWSFTPQNRVSNKSKYFNGGVITLYRFCYWRCGVG